LEWTDYLRDENTRSRFSCVKIAMFNEFSMNLVNVMKYVIAVDAVVLIISVLMQSRSGGGLGVAFGGGGGEVYRSKRGIEKILFNISIITGIILAVTALAIAILNT
jgi:preprotein translocase subunit SecG